MGLTKIDYKSCNYNDGLPVTIRFANKVGDVLTMGSARNGIRSLSNLPIPVRRKALAHSRMVTADEIRAYGRCCVRLCPSETPLV